MTEFRKIRYTGKSGAVVTNRWGTWDVSAATGSEYSPVRDVPQPDADEMVESTIFEGVGGAVKKDAEETVLPALDSSLIEPAPKPRKRRTPK